MARSGWRYHDRGRWHLGPMFVNYTRGAPWELPRITSWGIRIGRWTRNVTRGTDSFDTPGRGGVRRRYR
jgi:hypothetical protein